jgi:hypothetical protein
MGCEPTPGFRNGGVEKESIMTITRARTMVALLLTVLAVGCARDVAGLATGQPRITGTTSACNFVSAPLMPVPSRADDEPHLLIPKPSGWERESQHETERLRFAMAHGSHRAGRVAVASVDLKTVVGHHDPATEYERVRVQAEKDSGTMDLTANDTDVCGFPAKILRMARFATDVLPTRTEILMLVVVNTTGKTHKIGVHVSSNDIDSPDYQRATDIILSGFQVLAPTG